jgi:hypothetical protein
MSYLIEQGNFIITLGSFAEWTSQERAMTHVKIELGFHVTAEPAVHQKKLGSLSTCPFKQHKGALTTFILLQTRDK